MHCVARLHLPRANVLSALSASVLAWGRWVAGGSGWTPPQCSCPYFITPHVILNPECRMIHDSCGIIDVCTWTKAHAAYRALSCLREETIHQRQAVILKRVRDCLFIPQTGTPCSLAASAPCLQWGSFSSLHASSTPPPDVAPCRAPLLLPGCGGPPYPDHHLCTRTLWP